MSENWKNWKNSPNNVHGWKEAAHAKSMKKIQMNVNICKNYAGYKLKTGGWLCYQN